MQELIEFSGCLLNSSTLEIEAEFQQYVQPTENPLLNAFTTHLTGITQRMCVRAVKACAAAVHSRKVLNFHMWQGRQRHVPVRDHAAPRRVATGAWRAPRRQVVLACHLDRVGLEGTSLPQLRRLACLQQP